MASTPRNPTIAKVLYLRKAIEMWGRGIGLILDACEKAHLAAPKIYEDRGFVYTVFARPTAQEWQGKVGETDEVNREVNHDVNVGTNRGTNGTKDGTKKPEEDANGVNDGDKKGLGAINCGTKVGTKNHVNGHNDANGDINGTEDGNKEVGAGTNCGCSAIWDTPRPRAWERLPYDAAQRSLEGVATGRLMVRRA